MKKIKLGITGCLGRMGQQLIKSSKKNQNFKIISLTEFGIQNKKINGLEIQKNSEKAFKNIDGFNQPNASPRFSVTKPVIKSISVVFPEPDLPLIPTNSF